MRVFDEAGAVWELGQQIATGGEGSVFRLKDRPEWCVKRYHKRPIPGERLAKLRAFRSLSSVLAGSVAVPLGFVSEVSGSDEWSGVLLPYIDGHDVYELYNPQGRQANFRNATFEFVVTAALNLARVFESVHAQGVVVGDVSEQNIRVRPDATLALIDCDGFQISHGGRFFASNIGTPIWTPPELQGRKLQGIARTCNHDRFGLAQLIFLLLFCGRYPFAGRPLSEESLSPEEAVAKFAFAFDPAPAPALLEPPPGALRLADLPPRFGELFLRAFRKGSEAPDARPSAGEWAVVLGELRDDLVRCTEWEAHLHWRGAGYCPWCGVLERGGVDMFPGPPAQAGKDLKEAPRPQEARELARRLLDLEFEPIHLSSPAEALLQQGLRESGLLEPAWWVTLSKGLGPFGVFLRSGRRTALLRELESLRGELSSHTQKAALLYLGYVGAVRELERRARRIGVELESAVLWENQEVENYRLRHRNLALMRYLDGFLLRRYEIQGVSQGKKAALLSHNIVTAADVTSEAVRRVPGFTTALAERLERWRRECERGFRYEEPRWIPEGLRVEAAREAGRRTEVLLQQGRACEAHWNRMKLAYRRDQQALQALYSKAVKKCAFFEAMVKRLG